MQLISSPPVSVRISTKVTNETVAESHCIFEVSENTLRIFSEKLQLDYRIGINGSRTFFLQLKRALQELHDTNANNSRPEWQQFFLEGLERPATITVESFCDSADRCELTLTIEGEDSEKRLWVAIDESELQKVVECFR